MAEQTSSKVPQIRFKGFEGEWEKRTLGDLGSFKNGMNFGKEAMGHGNPFVNLQNVFGQFEVDDNKLELAESSSIQRRDYNLLKGDVLFIRSSVKPEGVGETALVTKTLANTTYSGFIIRYRPEVMMSDDFNRVAYRTTVVRKQVLSNASRSANTNINQDALRKIALQIPNFEEQAQIGKYFRELDSLIGLHQRKHDKLVTLKKAMLQKMFPQAGATTPEIRFKGFSDNWDENEFKTIASRSTQLSSEEYSPRIEYEDIVSGSGRLNKDLFKKASRKIGINFDEGDVLFGKLRPYLKNWWLAEFPGIAVGDFWVLRSAAAVSDFIYCLIQTDAFERIANQSAGSKMPRSDWKLVSNSLFRIPSYIEEQQKIGTYFRTVDKLISQHATQLQKLQQIKSACLEKMFV